MISCSAILIACSHDSLHSHPGIGRRYQSHINPCFLFTGIRTTYGRSPVIWGQRSRLGFPRSPGTGILLWPLLIWSPLPGHGCNGVRAFPGIAAWGRDSIHGKFKTRYVPMCHLNLSVRGLRVQGIQSSLHPAVLDEASTPRMKSPSTVIADNDRPGSSPSLPPV